MNEVIKYLEGKLQILFAFRGKNYYYMIIASLEILSSASSNKHTHHTKNPMEKQ